MDRYNNSCSVRFSSPRLDVNFCDDGASFPHLESGLEEVLNPPPTTLPFVAPSSFSISVDEDDLCFELGIVSTLVPDCRETSLGSSCVDVVVVEPTSRDFIAYVSPGPIDLFPISPLSSPPSPSLECPNLSVIDYHDVLQGKVFNCIGSLGTFEG